MAQIQLDKTREVKFDLSAIRDLEAALNGQALGSIVHSLSQMSITALTTALWAGLKHEDKTLNPSLVTKMLEKHLKGGGKMRPLMDAVSDAIRESGLFNEDDSPNEAPEATT